jgi:ABC-type lipoprotein export system ATPase subunit
VENLLRVEGLSHAFKNGSETTLVLQNISFHVRKGEMIALLGSSGSGKSTLLNLMAGLMKPTEGEIYIADHNIVKMNENKLAEFRRGHIGFIFQAYELLPNLTVRENIEMPLVFHSTRPSVRKQKALQLLEQVGIPDKAEMFPSQLSGGQQQRVSIARSLITEPSVIFADEPTGNLDTKTEEEILAILKRLNKTMNTTFIIVTHEREVAQQTQKIITLLDGQLEMSQPAVEPQAEAEEVQA